MDKPYANYRYSLTRKQQSDIQIFLRLVAWNNQQIHSNPAWRLLHDLTYAESWTEEPEFTVAGTVLQ